MSSLAQEESRGISLNVTWGWRKRFADGKPVVPFSHFLDYDRGENGELFVNEEEAETVRLIYGEFLSGLSFNAIGRKLEALGIKSPAGKDNWQGCTVKSILTKDDIRFLLPAGWRLQLKGIKLALHFFGGEALFLFWDRKRSEERV